MPKTILIVYNLRYVFPVVQSLYEHLYCWKRYSNHEVLYLNVAYGVPERLLSSLDLDAIIFHTKFLSRRWEPEKFRPLMDSCASLKSIDCLKIAMPQDEFIQTEILNEFINEFGIDHILTCAYEEDWDKIYDRIHREKVTLENTLTGYLSADTVHEVEVMKATPRVRTIDVGYRAWNAEAWLGEHGRHKVRIAEECQASEAAKQHHFDISLKKQDTIRGLDWFDFLLRCKTTIGVEGGASVLDRDGSIRKAVHQYTQEHPEASFEQIRDACFPGRDHEIRLACISPRHLEACLTETCQLLIEGHFNGILKPWEHYIPIKPDYSNLTEVLGHLQDDALLQKIARQAYQDVVLSEKYTYQSFVSRLDAYMAEHPKVIRRVAAKTKAHQHAAKQIQVRDDRIWKLIPTEVKYRATKRPILKKLAYNLSYKLQKSCLPT